MNLTTLNYLLFLTACVILYYVMPNKYKNHCLLALSIAFYCFAMPGTLIIMMLYIWVVFLLGLLMRKIPHGRKIFLILGIAVSAGFLFVYKYLDFTLSFFNPASKGFSLIAPIGISYVTFQCIAYLADIYKKKCPVQKNPVKFFLYALFFAKITAGPIEPPAKFFANLKQEREFSMNNAMTGLFLVASGFAKKLVVADMLAPGIAAVYSAPSEMDGLSIAVSAIMYSIQIYYDFSGYTDIARGSALFFGIELTENFRQPYSAASISDFWRRWHISLSDWLKNYIYIPLGGNRKGTLRKYLNLLITFLVSGIWHGAALTFIVWGALHGLFQIVGAMFKPAYTALRSLLHISENGLLHKTLTRVKTFTLVTAAWVFFRASDLGNALAMYKGLFTPWASLTVVLNRCMLNSAAIVLIVLTVLIISLLRKIFDRQENKSAGIVVISCTIFSWLVFASIMLSSNTAASSFIYFNF